MALKPTVKKAPVQVGHSAPPAPTPIWRPYKGVVEQIGKPIHVLNYGESGTRKSSFAATFPTPRLVLAFDPSDKMTPFFRAGERQEVVKGDDFYDRLQLTATDVFDKDGTLLTRVEQFDDPEPESPTGYKRFQERVRSLHSETWWNTIILDSLTMCQYAYLRYQMFTLNPDYKDPRLWYGHLKTEMTCQLLARMVYLPQNVVVIAHVGDKKDEFSEGLLRGAAAVGSLMGDLPAGYGEVYRAEVTKDKRYIMNTRATSLWYAASQIQAPNPCEMEYSKLWANW